MAERAGELNNKYTVNCIFMQRTKVITKIIHFDVILKPHIAVFFMWKYNIMFVSLPACTSLPAEIWNFDQLNCLVTKIMKNLNVFCAFIHTLWQEYQFESHATIILHYRWRELGYAPRRHWLTTSTPTPLPGQPCGGRKYAWASSRTTCLSRETREPNTTLRWKSVIF